MKNLFHNLLLHLDLHGLSSLKDLDVRVSRDERYPNLYNLKYGVLADKLNPIVQACRGAVVEDCGGSFKLVAYAFDRFFNLGEPGAAEIDWSSATVYEKYDGSLIKLFHWNGMWIVSTSGSVGGAGSVGSSGKSFEELFWETFDYNDYRKSDLDTDNVYIFELCAPENRIVVSYVDVLGKDHEGVIVCDANGNRIKIKSSLYVQLHRVRGNGEPDFSSLYLNDDLDEFLLHFPEYSRLFGLYVDRLNDLNVFVNGLVRAYAHLSQREFADLVLREHGLVSGIMFSVRAGKHRDLVHYVTERFNPTQLDSLLGLGKYSDRVW